MTGSIGRSVAQRFSGRRGGIELAFGVLGAVATLLAAPHPAGADVIGIGDITPSTTVNGEIVPDLPLFGGTVSGTITVGGTGALVGGTAAGQMTIDIPAGTDPLVSDNGVIGGNAQGLGVVRIVGLNSQWTMADTFVIGQEGQGFLEILSGARLSSNGAGSTGAAFDLMMGQFASGQGFATLDGIGSLMVNTNVSIGHEGSGSIEVLNSSRLETLQSASLGTVANVASNVMGEGFVRVSGAGSRWNVGLITGTSPATDLMDLTLGNQGRGTLEVTEGGRVRVGSDTFLGSAAGAYGEAVVSGRNSILWTFAKMSVGNVAGNATGVVHVNDNGVVRTDGTMTVYARGQVNLAGGTLLTPALNNEKGVIRGSGRIDADAVVNKGDVRNAAGVSNLRERLLFTGTVANNAGAIIESIGGEMEFEGAVTNSGQIFGRNAIFRFRGGLTNSGGSVMYIDNTVVESPLLTVSALAVGNSGSSSVIGDVTLSSNLDMEIGHDFSKLFVTGDANLGGALNISLDGGFTPTPGNSWEIIVAGDVNNVFSSLNAPVVPGIAWNLEYFTNRVVLNTVAPIGGSGADFNGDGIVDAADLTVLQNNFGLGSNPPPAATQSQGDANGDGVVNGADFLLWQQQFGGPPPVVPAAGKNLAAVPEPNGLLILAMASLTLPLIGRRRVACGM